MSLSIRETFVKTNVNRFLETSLKTFSPTLTLILSNFDAYFHYFRLQTIYSDYRLSIIMVSDFTELVETVITCPVCLKHFDQPRMLPCSHTFCFQCLEHMCSQNNGLLECPQRDGTTVERNEIAGLPLNQAVSDLVQLFGK